MPEPIISRPQTLRERAGQCVMVRLGSNLPPPTPVNDDAERVARLLGRCPIGGLILFRGAHPSVAEILADLQAASRFPLLVASDVERGIGQQIEGGTTFPHAQAVGAVDAPEAAAARLARTTAREARACGIHWAFAPVADVNTYLENPIIGIRAFGETPGRVSRCVRAYVQAARDEGLLTAAKHFPGHGRTVADSHDTLPIVRADRQALETVELPPFQAAIDARVDAMMTAHVAYPALDSEERPATASRPILKGLLREEMGFDGVVVSDSLLMEGGRTEDTPGAQAAALLRAGIDLLLDPDDPEAIVNGLVDAVDAGALPEARLDDACERVWRLKERMYTRWDKEAFAPSGRAIGTEAHREEAESIAREAIHVQASMPDTWPLPPERVDDGRALHVVAVTPRETVDALASLDAALQAAYPSVRYDALHANTSSDRYDAVRSAALDAPHLVLVCAVEPAAWHAYGLKDDQRAWVQDLLGNQKAVVVALGSPHVLDGASGASTRVCTYSTVPASQRALVAHMAADAGR